MIAQNLTAAFLSLALVAGGLAETGGSTRPDTETTPVRSVSVSSEDGRTVIGVGVGPDVEERHFLLGDPLRLVVDLEGARHALPRSEYSVGRGGVVRLRSSQFSDGVVRLVFELTRRPDYSVRRTSDGLRMSFDNPASSFSAWSTGSGTARQGASPASSAGPGPEADLREAGSPSADAARRVEGISVSTPDRPPQDPQTVPRITVNYDQATMQDVLAGFSEFAGVSIVPSNEAADVQVRGVTIADKPWDQALDAILSSHGLGWERLDSGIIIVDQLSALRGRDTLKTETRVFRINYAGADTVANALRSLTGDDAQVVPYAGTNSVIVTAPVPVLARMDSLVGAVDQRTAQVAIEAKIIFVDRTDVNALGITYDLKDQSDGAGFNQPVPMGGVPVGGGQGQQSQAPFAVDLGGAAIAGVANANDRIASPALQILANTVFGGFSLTTFIDALESHQLSDIQATPSIKVVDNQEARIQVGQRTPIRVLEPSAQLQQAQVNVQFEETGIILEVTPHVTNNNQVLLDLHAERSGIAEAPSDLGFAFDTQEGDTRLLLDNGETGVIGGLTLSDVSRSETGIPGLMDLPLLGGIFRTTRQTERKQDLIILVTPRIVSPQGGSPPAIPGGAPGRDG